METQVLWGVPKGVTFNFLASLINGNCWHTGKVPTWATAFNFLASLINGNESEPGSEHTQTTTFNFLGLFVTLYAKSTDKMPRQHTSNPKIPKVSQAIASPFY